MGAALQSALLPVYKMLAGCKQVGLLMFTLLICIAIAHGQGVDEPGAGGKGRCFERGKWYQVGERIETPDPCMICHCYEVWTTKKPYQLCSVVDCPQLPRVKNCQTVYHPGQCCPTIACAQFPGKQGNRVLPLYPTPQ